MIMKGVTEEKTSRIMEVLVSSVKPIQLMLGKILGIAAVGLTQFILWNHFDVYFCFCYYPHGRPGPDLSMYSPCPAIAQ
jgi:hypothetical protein